MGLVGGLAVMVEDEIYQRMEWGMLFWIPQGIDRRLKEARRRGHTGQTAQPGFPSSICCVHFQRPEEFRFHFSFWKSQHPVVTLSSVSIALLYLFLHPACPQTL